MVSSIASAEQKRDCRRAAAVVAAIITIVVNQIQNGIAQPLQLSPNSQQDLAQAIAIQEAHSDELMDITGVVGHGIGVGRDGFLVVKVCAEYENVAGVPAALDNLAAEIEVTGVFSASALNGCYRPIPIGVSVGNLNWVGWDSCFTYSYGCSAGTLGCVVQKNGKDYILSNNHVLARCNRAAINEFIDQPGIGDQGPPPCAEWTPNGCSPRVAKLSEFEPIQFGGSNNTMDAAIAEYLGSGHLCSAHSSCGFTPGTFVVGPSQNLPVKMCGRTSGLKTGTILFVNFTVVVNYVPPCAGVVCSTATFVGQFCTNKGFATGGDSGSLIVTNDSESNNYPVGLLFAHALPTGIATGTPIQAVLDRFGVTICSQ